MAEFRFKSRKNETNTHDFGVEKLDKPGKGQSLEFLESKVVVIPLAKSESKPQGTLPRLPRQLLDQLGDDAAIFAKVLELFPPAGVVEWTPKAERKKAVSP